MLRIQHRINDAARLRDTPPDQGVEMDIHGYGARLVVHHEAGVDAIDFEAWLEEYRHAFLIANVKEEGIERRVRDLLVERGIDRFVMLDLSFPALMKMVRAGESRVAVRVSEYEPAGGALRLAGRAAWVWLDCFEGGLPIPASEIRRMAGAGLKICLVSPELHGRDAGEIDAMAAQLRDADIAVDAVCTKYPERW